MKKVKFFVIGVCSLFLLACTPITRVSGEVFDVSGQPLAGAKVQIIGKSLAPNANLVQTTQADGRYDFGEIYVSGELPTEIKLTVSRDDYQTVTKDLKFNEDNVNKIVLENAGKTN